MTTGRIRIGLHGAPAGWVDSAGGIELAGRRAPIDWWLAADDRWHDPRLAPSIRQRCVDGTPVVETKLAVVGGDVVQTVYCVADHGGLVVARYENRSPSAVVVAVPGDGVGTTAATSGTRPRGIDLPAAVQAFPLSHGGSVAFAWSFARTRWRRQPTVDVAQLPAADQVARGWSSACERASRIPDAAARLTASRCRILMSAPREFDELLGVDPALGIVAVAERVRMGDPGGQWVEQIADAVRRLARRPADSVWTTRALSLAAYVLSQADEPRASLDVVDVWRTVSGAVHPPSRSDVQPGDSLASAAIGVAATEDRLARPIDPDRLHLFPDGATPWLGSNLEAHGVHAGPHHRVSFAIRWHGENAALLWEIDGPPGLRLLAPTVDPGFSTGDAHGETLLRMSTRR